MSIRKDGKVIAGQISLNIKTDNELSPTSENPIQNRVVTNALNTKQDIDKTVVTESTGALTVTPGNVYKWSIPSQTAGTLTFDTSELSGKYTSIPVYIELGEGSSVTGHDEIDKTGWYDMTWDGSSLSIQKSNSGDASNVIDETRDQSVQETLDELVDGKADKVADAVDGDLAGLDESGNLTDAGIPVSKVARNDSFYSEMGVGRAENLIDPLAPATRRTFGFDTACGPISITDNGSAVVKTMYGTTYIVNQLVPDEEGEYDIPLINGCKYLFRDSDGNESILTGSTSLTSQHVIGGVSKLINLTHWFGTGKEPTVEKFYRLFPMWKDYDIPYIQGSLLNYRGTGVQTVGFNAYDHSTGTAELLGGNKYQICGEYTSVSYVDQWGNTEELDLDEQGIFTPANNGILTVTGGNDTDTCVHLCWSGYKDFGKPDYKWEEYVKNIRSWDVTPYFPSGMNGIGDVQDEFTSSGSVQRFGIVDLSTLTWTSSGNTWTASVTGMKSNTTRRVSEKYNTLTVSGTSISVMSEDSPTGLFIYELATPVVTTFDQPLNLTYPVNDFGTEQSLPVNTTELLSTDLDADIQYSIDFTRTVQHYSEIEKDVEELVKEKDNLARQDGDYGTKGLGATTARQLVDPNAPATEREFGFDTAAGNITISDNGTGVIDKLMGTTHVANQLVHDTNMNTKSSSDGKLALTDVVGGNLSKLEIHGGCVVHNQLVKDSVEKTVTGTGKLGCEDGVAGNAKSLVMTAPRSVVMNQLLNYRDVSTTQNGVTITSNHDGTYTVSTDAEGATATTDLLVAQFSNGVPLLAGHTYLLTGAPSGSTGSSYYIMDSYSGWNVTGVTSNKHTRSASSGTGYWKATIRVVSGTIITTPVTFAPQIVDLTQYFNGSQTLIDSIQTWDDLVAYDPSFASYVPYNTGTVKGVQPTVKVNHTTDVACPVELFGGISGSTYPIVNTEDTYDAVSGIVTKAFDKVDLGTLVWIKGAENRLIGTLTTAAVPTLYPGSAFIGCYVNVSTSTQMGTADKVFCIVGATQIIISDSAYSDAATFKAAMSGVYLYYELATPTTSQYNSTVIPTVDIYNSVLQTVGTRQCPLSLTYDGREQTIALDPTHVYVFNDNQIADSLITNESSIDAVGGEDMLVDVTQLYNGDSDKISSIHSWASLSTLYHRYRDLLPYNPGTVEPETPVIKVYPDEYAYGVVYNPNTNSPVCQKVELRNGVITEVEEFTSMPCHQLYRCVMDDLGTRHISYYLDDEDSTKKYNGTRNGVTSDGSASVLTGADGDVMVEIPISYWDIDEDYNSEGKILYLISDRPFMGSHSPAEIHDFFFVSPDGGTPRVQYVGAYRASVCNADGTPINTTEGALSQSAGTTSTNIARSIAGALPYVNVNQNDLLVRAKRNSGSTVNSKFHQWLFVLMMIEQGSLNTQSISQGYSNGIQNAYCFWRKSGRVNAGNGTAELYADTDSQDMDNFQSLKVGSTTVQRDTLMDENGRYAWSIYNRSASSTRYYTDSSTPANGDTVYSASTGDTTSGTVASYTIKAENLRTIQWQYRGIENPFGEVWEFEHGIQKYAHSFVKSIKANNVVYERDVLKDGATSRAWTKSDGTVTVWTVTNTLTNVHAFSDPDLTQDTGYAVSVNVYGYNLLGYWETLSMTDYTGTEQQSSANPVYTWRRHRWPISSGYVKKFDPVTFLILTTGGSASTYLCDYYYDAAGTGSRVVYRGGYAYSGASVGLGFVSVRNGLTFSLVSISGRLSA